MTTDGVLGDVGQVAEVFQQAKGENDGGVMCHGYGGVATLNAVEGGQGYGSTLGEQAHADAPTAACIFEVTPEFFSGRRR